MRFVQNPFDRDLNSIPFIRYIIHSTSLSEEILYSYSSLNRLVKLNDFKGIEIIPLPTNNDAVQRKLTDNSLVYTEYISNESGVSLIASNGSIYNVVSHVKKQPPQNLWKQVVFNSTVTLADIFASNIGDYLVVGANDPSLNYKVSKDNIITADKALDLVRILLTAHGLFYISPKVPTNEGFYYLYRFKKLFREFQHAWTVAVYSNGKGMPKKIQDYLISLGTRLEFTCRAYDNIAFFSLKTANNDTQNNQLYHLVYFVMLITGIFDDLAHIIEEFYYLQIKGRRNVSLRISKNKGTTRFYSSLQHKNTALYSFLIADKTQGYINAFYPIRDSLQHRELPRGIHYSNSSEYEKNVFELSDNTVKELESLSASFSYIIKLGQTSLLEPLLFIDWSQKLLIDLVNSVLSFIDWDSVCKTLPSDIQDKIKQSNIKFEQGVGKFLKFPSEPLYF